MKKNELSAICSIFAAVIAFLINGIAAAPGSDTVITSIQGIIYALEAGIFVFCACYGTLFVLEKFFPKTYKKMKKKISSNTNKAVNSLFGED